MCCIFSVTRENGTNPYRDQLIFDAAGNLYGTASFGGTQKHGAVYKMTPLPDGTWSEALLYSFAGQQAGDGERPMGNLVFDTAGNLYGITANGGSLGCGIVYQLTPSGGSWSESVIHTFTCVDGRYPQAGLVIDGAGNLYGTAMQGASPACGTGCGTVFKLAPSGGSFTFSVIYSFQGGNDGANPQGSLAFDNAGSLYGTTTYGGSTSACGGAGCGTVFKLTPSGGSWTESILYGFTGVPDGANPFSQLTFDAAGNIYGTTYQGGAVKVGCADQTAGCGTVFKLTASGGIWTESVVHRFLANSSSDGANPLAGVTIDAHGNLFGTTLYGGTNSGVGTLYKIQP